MFNSVIVAYRNRIQNLTLFLTALSTAAKNAQQPVELVLVDLGSGDREHVESLIAEAETYLPVNWVKVEYTGPFWKSKALNLGATQAKGEYLTFLDVDVIVQPAFFENIEGFYADPPDGCSARTKLGVRVAQLDPHTTALCHGEGLDWMIKNVFGSNKHQDWFYETIQDRCTGNACCTLRRDDYFEIGGYDDAFKGYSGEDFDFLCRAHQHLGPTIMHFGNVCYHLHHRRDPKDRNWYTEGMIKNNTSLYLQRRAAGFPKPEISDDWGHFPTVVCA